MKVLEIEKFFYDRGGSSRVFFETISGLRERGSEVAEFSMQDQRNFDSDYDKYFASGIPELKEKMSIADQWKVFRRLFKSEEIEEKLGRLIDDFRPDVAHIHNAYHHLSASTFLKLKEKNIPMVLTLHDVFPLCPNHSLLRGETLGEKDFKNKLYNCTRYKCIDNKFLPSLAGTLEAYYYRYKKIWDSVEYFVCPSQFMADKMVEYGFPEKKMRVIRNPFTVPVEYPPLGTKVVYLGRLHYEKGIKVFLRAAKELRDLPLVVAGSGPDEAWVNEYIHTHRLNHIERVGWVSGERWREVMNNAKVIVVPSVFLENCSLSILEALANGRIVVASDRGGNPELVINGKSGFLCKPEDPADLARVIREAAGLDGVTSYSYIQNGRELIQKNHDPAHYFEELQKVFEEASRISKISNLQPVS